MKAVDQKDLIHDTKWDVLILLDACRYDVFEEVLPRTGLNGDLTRADTHATATLEWLNRMWRNISYDKNKVFDICYISEHPGAWKDDRWFRDTPHTRIVDCFRENVPIWKEYGWSKEGGPDRLSSPPYCLQRSYHHQEKTELPIMIHLIPPHQPFYCVSGQKFRENLGIGHHGGEKNLIKWARNHEGGFEQLESLYVDNVEVILRVVGAFVSKFDGDVVITSDHGECIGRDRRTYGHTQKFDFLRYVPWFEVKK